MMATATVMEEPLQPRLGKRKAESQDNERLSKRMSLLNLERDGQKLYVPVEAPRAGASAAYSLPAFPSAGIGTLSAAATAQTFYSAATASAPPPSAPSLPFNGTPLLATNSHPTTLPTLPPTTAAPIPTPPTFRPTPPAGADSFMQLDDSSHKVYIYNLDDELASCSSASSSRPSSPTPDGSYPPRDPSSSGSNGKLVFLPDISAHLRAHRLPRGVVDGTAAVPAILRPILPNSEGQLAGVDVKGMQLVLYGPPASLTGSDEEKSSVRRAIVEARQRAREKLALAMTPAVVREDPPVVRGAGVGEGEYDPDAMDLS